MIVQIRGDGSEGVRAGCAGGVNVIGNGGGIGDGLATIGGGEPDAVGGDRGQSKIICRLSFAAPGCGPGGRVGPVFDRAGRA